MTRNRYMVGLVLLTFFVISLLTNILGPIVPDIISNFHVSLTAAGFLVFAFFIAYGVMSIPAGFLVERFTEKPVMISAFAVAMLGSMSFALFPEYKVAVISLFVIGAGMSHVASRYRSLSPRLRRRGTFCIQRGPRATTVWGRIVYQPHGLFVSCLNLSHSRHEKT